MEGMEAAAQHIGRGVMVYTSKAHSFGTDALLLADFAAPRPREQACDLGTGCGIIPLYWLARGGPERVWGMDVQPRAVEQFTAGIRASGGEGRLLPLLGDLRALPPELPRGRLELVTCNPPYQRGTGLLPQDPAAEIARHERLCTLEEVCHAAALLLKFGGRLCLCQRPERLADAVCAMRGVGLEPKVLRMVSKEQGDTPWLFLLEGKKGGKPDLRVLPPLAVYQEGSWSPDLQRIYSILAHKG